MNEATTAGIPANVLRQGKKADEAIAQIAKGEAVTIIESEEPIEKPAASAKPTEPAKKPEASEPSEDTWKARYNALKGKYDAEVPRMAEQLSELQETARRQQTTIDTLLRTIEAGGDGKPAKSDEVIDDAGKAPTHTKGPKLINKENFQGYGEEVQELVDVINTQAQLIESLQGKLGTVETRVQSTTKNTFLTELKSLCPSWQKLNDYKPFLAWLEKKDSPRARETRFQAFDYFVEQQDAPQVAQFFNDFIQETGWTPDGDGRGAITRQAGLEHEIVPAPDVHREIQSDDASKRLGFPIVTRDQLSKATRDRVAGRITEQEFNTISDNYQRTYAAIRAGKLTLS